MYHDIYLAQFKKYLILKRGRTDNKLASDDSIYGDTPFTVDGKNGEAEFEKGCCIGFTLLKGLSQKQGKLESWNSKLKIINDWSGEYEDLQSVVVVNGKETKVKDVFKDVMQRVFAIQDKVSVLPADPNQYITGGEQEYINRSGRVARLRGDVFTGHFTKALLAKYFAHPSIQALYKRKDVMIPLNNHRHITIQMMDDDLIEHFDININPEATPKKYISKDADDIADAIIYYLNDGRELGEDQIRLMMQWLYIGDIAPSEGVSTVSAAVREEHERTFDQLAEIEMANVGLLSFEEVNSLVNKAVNDFVRSLSDEEFFNYIHGDIGTPCGLIGWIYSVLDPENIERVYKVTRIYMFEDFDNPAKSESMCNLLEVEAEDKLNISTAAHDKLVDEHVESLAKTVHNIVVVITIGRSIPDAERFEYYSDTILTGFSYRRLISWVLGLACGEKQYERDSHAFKVALKKAGLKEVGGKEFMTCFAFLHRLSQSDITKRMEDTMLRLFGFLKDHPAEKENLVKLFQQAVKVFKLKIKNADLKAMSVLPPKKPVLKESLTQPATLFKQPSKKRTSTKTTAAKRTKK